MKRLCPNFFMFLNTMMQLVIMIAGSTCGQETLSLRIMTYNIHHGEGVDGKLDLDRIAAIIRRHDCDLVALQEVDRKVARSQDVDQIAELAMKTEREFCFGKAIDLNGGEYGLGILSKLPIAESKSHRLPSSEKREQRIALEAVIAPATGAPFLFVCTHLDHSGGENDRAVQVAEIRRLFGNGPSQAILAGDFNASLDQPELSPLSDIWMDVDNKKRSPTIPSQNPTKKIDFIVLPTSSPWSVESAMVLDEPIASDHLPLVTTIRWKGDPK